MKRTSLFLLNLVVTSVALCACDQVPTNPLIKIEVVDPVISYSLGDEFIKPVVNAYYKDTTTKEVTNESRFTGYDMNSAGKYTVSVSFGGLEEQYTISVIDPNRVDTYNHEYDDLEISTIEAQYSTYTYRDYAKYSLYTFYGYPMSFAPSLITAKFLVVPIWFTDSTDYIKLDHRDNVKEDIRKAYFGSEEETGWESVKTYYEKDSFGRLRIEGMVTDWYETDEESTAYYTDNYMTELLSYRVCNWAKENVEDYASYDTDKDGFIDGLVLIYACYDQIGLYLEKQKNEAGNMWAYTSRLIDPNQKNLDSPGINDYFWSSYDFIYGSDNSEQMAFTRERTGLGSFGNGDTSHRLIDSHTFVHETGHLFGLNDYYDYSGLASPALGFSMQDENVGAHDPYSRFALGWSKAIIPTETCKLRVKPMEESGEFILLSPSFDGSAFGEYLAIELFTPTGLNEADCKHTYDGRHHPTIEYGVRLWHIDSRLYKVISINPFTGEVVRGRMANSVTDGYIVNATSNSSYIEGYNTRAIDYAGSYDYNELQVIRRNYDMYDENGNLIVDTSNRSYHITNDDFFQAGDYFTLHNYRSQFVETDTLNCGKQLGWSIYFDEVNENGMTVTCIKESI